MSKIAFVIGHFCKLHTSVDPKPWLRVSDGWLTILMAG